MEWGSIAFDLPSINEANLVEHPVVSNKETFFVAGTLADDAHFPKPCFREGLRPVYYVQQ